MTSLVASEVGGSKSTLYRHFADKADGEAAGEESGLAARQLLPW